MPINPQDAPDCEFYGESSAGLMAELATDLSGLATDFTVSGLTIYETASSRGDPLTHRTIDFEINTDNSATNYLYTRGRASLRFDGSSNLIVEIESVDVHTMATTLSGSSEDFVVSWVTEPNPFASGAGDAYRSELTVYNRDTELWEHETFTHEADLSAGDEIVFGGSSPGAGVFSGTINSIRLARAFHPATELYETYVAQTATPTNVGETRLELPVPTSDTGAGDDEELAGPVEAVGARAVRRNDLLLAGPIVNELLTGAWFEDSTWTLADPDDADYFMHLETLRWRPIPPSVNRGRVRVFVQQNGASASALGIRCYSSSSPGPLVSPVPSPDDYVRYFTGEIRTADDGTGTNAGAWVDLGTVKIERDQRGHSWFWLGFDPGTLTDYRVLAWTIEPVQLVDVGNGGAGLGEAG